MLSLQPLKTAATDPKPTLLNRGGGNTSPCYNFYMRKKWNKIFAWTYFLLLIPFLYVGLNGIVYLQKELMPEMESLYVKLPVSFVVISVCMLFMWYVPAMIAGFIADRIEDRDRPNKR